MKKETGQIIHEDDYLLIVNKPPGLVVHQGAGHPTGTLAHILSGQYPEMASVGDATRPGIVHRLDKGTSGVMVVAKAQRAYEGLVRLFSSHRVHREYQCLVRGKIKALEGLLDAPIGRHPTRRQKMAVNRLKGKKAQTRYEVARGMAPFFFLHVWPLTGRTHQIRVHLAGLLKAPVVNDQTYGNPPQDKQKLGPVAQGLLGDYPHPLLHSAVLGFTHPITKRDLLIEVPLPDIFQRILDSLE